MTPIETFALILIIASAVKLVVVIINPKSWLNMVKNIWINITLATIISLVLASIVLYYLLQELTIVQILATTLFVALLIAAGMAVYANELMKIFDKALKDKSLIKKSWLYILVWLVLLIWGLKELFA